MNAIQHSNGQDNINVNEISESLTSASSAPVIRTRRRSFPLLESRHRKFSCSAIRIRLEEHLADPSGKQRRCNQFVSEQIVLVYIPVVPAEDRSIERVSSWRSPNYVETQVRLRKDWRSVLSRRFSSSIKTTNINTEEIFSVHSTFFFSCSEENTARTRPWPTPTPHRRRRTIKKQKVTVRTLFSAFRSSRSKASVDISGLHLNNLGASRLLKTPKIMKSSEDSSSSICTAYE